MWIALPCSFSASKAAHIALTQILLSLSLSTRNSISILFTRQLSSIKILDIRVRVYLMKNILAKGFRWFNQIIRSEPFFVCLWRARQTTYDIQEWNPEAFRWGIKILISSPSAFDCFSSSRSWWIDSEASRSTSLPHVGFLSREKGEKPNSEVLREMRFLLQELPHRACVNTSLLVVGRSSSRFLPRSNKNCCHSSSYQTLSTACRLLEFAVRHCRGLTRFTFRSEFPEIKKF